MSQLAEHAVAATGTMSEDAIRETLARGLAGKFAGGRILVLIPDHTRTLPLPILFRALAEVLHDAARLDFMVALGTHPPLSQESLDRLVGMASEERTSRFPHVSLTNHAWDDPGALASIGIIEAHEIRSIAGPRWHPSLPDRIDIRLNRAALDHDHIIILGPTFPHEVVGFSGGAKYLFPGISGADMIDATHWLGALAGVVGTIGIKDTPVRTLIHAAAARLKTPVTLVALTVQGEGLAGMFIGNHLDAWGAAADLSAERHVHWSAEPYQRALACAPPMYDELWTAAKAMYKLEPAMAIGGEVVIYAPHLDTVSRVHGKYIYDVGYHILPYFLAEWERFRHVPLGVLAHSTHLRGSGVMDGTVEKANVRVTLASRISAEDCSRLNLGYLDPDSIDVDEWRDREDEGVLFVPKAGERLYRVR